MRFGRFQTFLEIAAVFAVFFLFGAWKVPDVNEAHYIGKAINYWNPLWIPNDPFLQSRDAHWTFYIVFGWLSFFCPPTTMAWIGRITAWSLLAWSWQRLSYALIPVRWTAIPTALALAYYIEAFNMAGEWLIGGIEGKSLAYPFVFFALEAMLRRRWNRTGIFLGIATALHVLVGGWATLIAGVIFFTSRKSCPKTLTEPQSLDCGSVNFPWIGLIVGGLTALCGLVPVLMLDAGTSAEVIRKAQQIYVFERLPHHLVPYLMKDSFLLRFALLTLIWILLCRQTGGRKQRIFNAFVWGTLGIAAVGMILAYSLSGSREWSAGLLRFYWFRLSDIVVPMGIALGAVRICLLQLNKIQTVPIPSFAKALSISIIIAAIYFAATYICFGYFNMLPDSGVPWAMTLLICLGLCFVFPLRSLRPLRLNFTAKSAKDAKGNGYMILFYLAIAFYAPLTALPKYADLRVYAGQCRTDPVGPNGTPAIAEWQDMCQWIEQNTPQTAKFWVPRDGHTFKWYAHRSDIGTWKNIPQDAESIVRWRKSMDDLYRYKSAEGVGMTDRLITTLLNAKTDGEIADLQQKYGFEYILCAQSYEMPKHAVLQRVYENDVYVLYRVFGGTTETVCQEKRSWNSLTQK